MEHPGGEGIYEENPFEDEVVAGEWIASRESDQDRIRARELNPILRNWSREIHPERIVEIGSGQGICADQVQGETGHYVGIEPSKYLVDRAREKYAKSGRDFIIGNAYALPIKTGSVDAVFSVNVWFHLENLDRASEELGRILIPGGHFLVSTANPDSYKIWESWFSDYTKEGKRVEGRIRIPVNPLSRNIFYKHSIQEMRNALTAHGLVIERTQGFGRTDAYKDDGLFINIFGHKLREAEMARGTGSS